MEMRSQLPEVTNVVEHSDHVEYTVENRVKFDVWTEDGETYVAAHDLSIGGTKHEVAATDHYRENFR